MRNSLPKMISCIGLSSILFTSSCERASHKKEDTANLKQLALPSSKATLKSADGVTSLNQDPATVLGVIVGGLKVANELKSLFGKKDEGISAADVKAIKRDLATIKSQNTQTQEMLSKALVILNQLGVTIKANTQETIQQLISIQADANLEAFYQAWQGALEGGVGSKAEREAKALYPVQLLKLHDSGLQLMKSEVWGYAPFQAVGRNMLAEFWLRRKLKKAKEHTRASARDYSAYFSRVLSPQVPASVTAQLVEFRAQQARLELVLDQADAYVASKPISTRVAHHFIRSQNVRGGTQKIYVDLVTTIQGNRNEGYRLFDFQTNERAEAVNNPGDHGGSMAAGGGGVGGHFYADSPQKGINAGTYVEAEDPVNNNDMSFQGKIAYWNAVAKACNTAKVNISLLERAEQTAQVYQTVAIAASKP